MPPPCHQPPWWLRVRVPRPLPPTETVTKQSPTLGCRPTTKSSGGTPAYQHAGARQQKVTLNGENSHGQEGCALPLPGFASQRDESAGPGRGREPQRLDGAKQSCRRRRGERHQLLALVWLLPGSPRGELHENQCAALLRLPADTAWRNPHSLAPAHRSLIEPREAGTLFHRHPNGPTPFVITELDPRRALLIQVT